MISLLSFNALLHAVLVVKQKTDGRNNAESESPKTLLFRVLYATLNYKIFAAFGEKQQQQRVSAGAPDARRGGQQVHPIAHVHEPGGPEHYYEHPPRCQRHRRRSHGASQRSLPPEGRVARRPELDANEVRVYFNFRTGN